MCNVPPSLSTPSHPVEPKFLIGLHVPRLQVYAWGCNAFGQLGLNDKLQRRSPALVEGLWALPVAQLAAGAAHSAAVTSAGFLFTWGANSCGQLGLPAAAEVAAQQQVKTMTRHSASSNPLHRDLSRELMPTASMLFVHCLCLRFAAEMPPILLAVNTSNAAHCLLSL